MTAPRTERVPYGGDYNPEQWPEPVRDDDHRLFTRARIDTLTVGVFAWSLTQPAEDTHDFTVLDRTLDRATATATAGATPSAPAHRRTAASPSSRATRSRSVPGTWPCCGFSRSGGRARPAPRTCGRSSC